MPAQNRLTVYPTAISVTYNKFNDTLTGDTNVYVNAVYNDEQDSFDAIGDDLFIINSDFFTFFDFTLDDNLVPVSGDYNYNIIVTGSASALSKTVAVSLKVIDTDVTPPADFIYKEKYFIEREKWRTEISQLVSPSAVLEPIEINGKVEYSYQSRTDLFEPIIASYLQLNLEADTNLTFEDLYSEEEKQYQIKQYYKGKLVFIGYVNPDGILEDLTASRWNLELNCMDGLSTLKDLTFSLGDGATVLTKMSALDIITICLNKTGLILPININCKVFYEGFDGVDDILAETVLNTERFFKDNSEPMNCDAVLRSILTIFKLTLFQMNGEWFLNRNIDLFEEVIFTRYIDGVKQDNFIYEPFKNIGSHINGIEDFEAIHVNANQRKSISASVQAYRINYEYGGARAIFQNPELKLEGSGLTIPGWLVSGAPDGAVYRNESGFGVQSTTKYFDLNNVPPLLTLNQTVFINAGAVFNLSINFSNESTPPLSTFGLRFAIAIGNQFLREDGTWATGGASIYIDNTTATAGTPNNYFIGKGNATYGAQIKAPISGNLQIIIYRDTDPNHANPAYIGGTFRINSIHLAGTSDGDVKGRLYTAQRKSKVSTVTKANNTVYNGDSISDLFVGTIYKSDFDTPTQFWYREDKPLERKELLAINVEDELRMNPRPMINMSGDIKGFLPYLSVLMLSFFDGKKFMFKNYSYDFDSDINKADFKEFSNDYLEDGEILIDVRDNYGNAEKATIN